MEQLGDVLVLDGFYVFDALGGQVVQIAVEVAAIGVEGIGRQPIVVLHGFEEALAGDGQGRWQRAFRRGFWAGHDPGC